MVQASTKHLSQLAGASLLAASLLLPASESNAFSFTSADRNLNIGFYTPGDFQTRTTLGLQVAASPVRQGFSSSAVVGTRYDFQGTFSGASLLPGINPFTSTRPQDACPAGQVCISGSLFVTSGAFQRTTGASQSVGTTTQVNSVRLTNFAFTNNSANRLLYQSQIPFSYSFLVTNGNNLQQNYNRFAGILTPAQSTQSRITTYNFISSVAQLAPGQATGIWIPTSINSTNADGSFDPLIPPLVFNASDDVYNKPIEELNGYLTDLNLPSGSSLRLPNSADTLVLSLPPDTPPDELFTEAVLTDSEFQDLMNVFSGYAIENPENFNFRVFGENGEEFVPIVADADAESVPEPSTILGLMAIAGLIYGSKRAKE